MFLLYQMQTGDLSFFLHGGNIYAGGEKHMKVVISTHMLPNSGPLLCFPLEFAKALLQTAYFCFCSVLLQSSKPPPCLAPQPLPPATSCFILLRYVMVNWGRGGRGGETGTEMGCFHLNYLTQMTFRITVYGCNWTLEKEAAEHQWSKTWGQTGSQCWFFIIIVNCGTKQFCW